MKSEPIKFLLVDDIPQNLVALEALLRREDLEILTARSGPEALELLLVHEIALAFLDVQMPGMDGFELAELMRGAERTKHVPIIFVTAGANDPQRVFKGYESGAVDFLFKPIDPRALKGKADVFFELYRQRRELSNALRLNEMFVAILGHDLRNPLTTILMGAQSVQRQVEDEGSLRTLRRMSSAGQRMKDMIEQLLDLTRARLAGGLGFVRSRKPVDVSQLVQRTVDELRVAHADRELVVEAMGDCTTTGDADRLLQVFSNLLANALHHGAEGAPVRVTVGGSEREIEVCVRNRGVIPPECLPTIFEPFGGRQRVPYRSRGLGLGLFISQQIAVAHGGRVHVHSGEESGTSFTVRLPRKTATIKHETVSGIANVVLIVDDDEGIRESLRDAFEAEGYVTQVAPNGLEGLEQLTRGSPRPDVVVLDLVMPVMDGARLYEAMQADPELAKIPVLVSTSTPERAPRGVVVIPKPVKLERLLGAVAELVRARAALRAR